MRLYLTYLPLPNCLTDITEFYFLCEFNAACNSSVKLRGAAVLFPLSKDDSKLARHNVTRQVQRSARELATESPRQSYPGFHNGYITQISKIPPAHPRSQWQKQ